MSILQSILDRSNKGPVPVATPEWGDLDGTLAVRRLAPAERTAFYDLAHAQKPQPGNEFLALMAAYCTVQKKGRKGEGEEGSECERAFADGDWKALATDPGSGSAIERLAEAADEANVLSDGMRELLKKKSATTDASANTSASPETSESA